MITDNQAKEERLEPCPGCGSHPVKRYRIGIIQLYRIVCPECRATTYWHGTKEDAIEAWNRRDIW